MFLKHVHNLFTRALWLPSPVGLRLEISCESDKKKMNLIFNYDKKFPLTEKMKHASRRKKKKRCVKKFRARQPRRIRNRRDEETSLLIVCAPRVDRLNLCGQFPASASGGANAQQVVDAGNRYRYHRACFDVRYSSEPADDPPIFFNWTDHLFCFFRATLTCR